MPDPHQCAFALVIMIMRTNQVTRADQSQWTRCFDNRETCPLRLSCHAHKCSGNQVLWHAPSNALANKVLWHVLRQTKCSGTHKCALAARMCAYQKAARSITGVLTMSTTVRSDQTVDRLHYEECVLNNHLTDTILHATVMIDAHSHAVTETVYCH